MTTLEVNVTGMSCGNCENAVKRTLMKLNGVETVTASHSEQRVVATYDPARLAPDDLKEAIESLGYKVGGTA